MGKNGGMKRLSLRKRGSGTGAAIGRAAPPRDEDEDLSSDEELVSWEDDEDGVATRGSFRGKTPRTRANSLPEQKEQLLKLSAEASASEGKISFEDTELADKRVQLWLTENRQNSKYAKPLTNRAVRLDFLLRYAEYLKMKLGGEKPFRRLTTEEVVHGRGAKAERKGDEVSYKSATPARHRTSNDFSFSIRGVTERTGQNMVDFARNTEESRAFVEELLTLEIDLPAGARKVLSLGREGLDPALAVDDADIDVDEVADLWFGTTDVFVSHPWQSNFWELIEAIKEPRCTGSKTYKEHYSKYFWIDIFAVNQHYLGDAKQQENIKQERKRDLKSFENVVSNATSLVLFFDTWQEPALLERAWCWYEIRLALRSDHSGTEKKINLALTQQNQRVLKHLAECFTKQDKDLSPDDKANMDTLKTMLENVNVESSECLVPTDRSRILGEIEQDPGFQKANESVKLAVARVLITTADSLLQSRQAVGTHKLYQAMLEFVSDKREKAKSFLKLARANHIRGRPEQSKEYCELALELQKELLKERSLPSSVLREVESEMSDSYNSLGRYYADIRKRSAIDDSLTNLRKALDIRSRLGLSTLNEVQYNIGRAIVQHYEWFNDKEGKRAMVEELEDAKKQLELALEAQQTMEAEMERQLANAKDLEDEGRIKADMKVFGSMGATYVFLGKVMDLLYLACGKAEGGNDNAHDLFFQGARKQVNYFGQSDARVFMTKQDTGRHYRNHGEFVLAWHYLVHAHRGLRSDSRDFGNNPLKLLECLAELLEVRECVATQMADGITLSALPLEDRVLSVALETVDWVETDRPANADHADCNRQIRKIRKYAIQTAYRSKAAFARAWVKHPKYSDFDEGDTHGPGHPDMRRNHSGLDTEERVCSDELARENSEAVEQCRDAEAFEADLVARLAGNGTSTIKSRVQRLQIPTALHMNAETLMRRMPAGVADIVICDAPYNVGIDKQWDELGHRNFVAAIERWSRLLVRVLSDDGVGFAFTNAQYVSHWMTALRTARGAAAWNEVAAEPAPEVIVESAVWFKPDAAWRSDFVKKHAKQLDKLASQAFKEQDQIVRHATEMVVIFRRRKTAGKAFKRVLDKSSFARNKDAPNVWEVKKCSGSERLTVKKDGFWHPTQKPLNVMKPLVDLAVRTAKSRRKADPSARGKALADILRDDFLVVEPFLGTGSGVMAAMDAGVPSMGSELDAHWVSGVQYRITKKAEQQAASRFG